MTKNPNIWIIIIGAILIVALNEYCFYSNGRNLFWVTRLMLCFLVANIAIIRKPSAI